jgi:crotonobetaine/carnitine-CoA ligase
MDFHAPAGDVRRIARLDRNAVPSCIQVVKEIPKTASEKVQERFLVDLLSQDAAAVFATDR